jgi:hypothetical protein
VLPDSVLWANVLLVDMLPDSVLLANKELSV